MDFDMGTIREWFRSIDIVSWLIIVALAIVMLFIRGCV